MIAVKNRPATPEAPPAPSPRSTAGRLTSRWTTRASAALLIVTMVGSLGGGGLIDLGSAYALQSRAAALHAHWAYMRDHGIPDEHLAGLEHQWTQSQASRLIGTATLFWLPGGADTLKQWERESEAIWSRDLGRFRADAQLAEQRLHRALGDESFVDRKGRLEALASGTSPRDFATLRDGWTLQAKLVPIDRNIAVTVAGVSAQIQRANGLGIRSDPAPDYLARATTFKQLPDTERLARAGLLAKDLGSLAIGLQYRLDAAGITKQNLDRTSNQISIAGIYGIDLGAFQKRLANSQTSYAATLSAATFNSITQDVKQIYADVDRAIAIVLSQTRVISGVAMIFQNHSLSCEEAATSMALTHQGIRVSQDQILRELGADLRPKTIDAQGRVRWGNPYQTFVGSVNGSESNYTGYGTFYPPLVRVAKAHGAKILAYGSMSAATIYARLLAGHPVVVFSTWDWRWHPRHDYLSFDGQWIPWIGPGISSHVYTAVGVSPSRVLINDPIRGQYWVSKGSFEAGYSDFGEAIVFA